MRKIVSLMIAAAMMAPTIASADPGWDHGRGPDHGDHGDRGDRGRGPDGGWDHGRGGGGWRHDGWHDGRPGDWRQFRVGERFERGRAWRYAPVDYRYYRLRPPPRGYRWVRNGDDAVLIGITSGIVASVIVGAMMH